MRMHTDGPWEAQHSGSGDARVVSAGIPTKHESFRATIVQRTSWENARLIAAAPEMLKVLRLILKVPAMGEAHLDCAQDRASEVLALIQGE